MARLNLLAYRLRWLSLYWVILDIMFDYDVDQSIHDDSGVTMAGSWWRDGVDTGYVISQN